MTLSATSTCESVIEMKRDRASVILLHPQDAEKGWQWLSGESFTWLYLGQEVSRREKIALLLGRENYHSIGSRLQETAYAEKAPFLEFITKLGHHQKNKLYWWASNISYKSPLTSDLFLHWCYAAILEAIVAQGEWENSKIWEFPKTPQEGVYPLLTPLNLPAVLSWLAAGKK